MSTHKRLKSVAHSIAHHSVSGLSNIHPHLSEACEEIGLSSIEIELIADNPCPKEFEANSPIEISLNNLKKTFTSILESEGFKLNDLSVWFDWTSILALLLYPAGPLFLLPDPLDKKWFHSRFPLDIFQPI